VPRNNLSGLPGLEDVSDIPVTYVPARNTILLGLAMALAEVRRAEAIYIGANALDYSGYPDCRPAFISAFQALAGVATKAGIDGHPPRIEAPLIHLSKAQIIRTGIALNVPYELTWSCYEGGDRPCGECDSCRLRAKGFEEAGAEDPLLAVEVGERGVAKDDDEDSVDEVGVDGGSVDEVGVDEVGETEFTENDSGDK